MPSQIKGIKHAKFKLRANSDLPTREFKVEFTPHGLSISKKGDRIAHHLRWRPLLGQMEVFWGEYVGPDTDWRAFTVPLKPPAKGLAADVVYIIEFSEKGIRAKKSSEAISGKRIFWSWRTLINVAIVGI